MNWSDIGKTIGDALPILGGALGGPLGAEVGNMAAKALGCNPTPSDVAAKLKADPQAIEKLQAIEASKEVELAKIAAQKAATAEKEHEADLSEVNQTIRTEAVGKSWLQRNAHPIALLMTVGCVIGIYFVLPLDNKSVPSVPSDAWMMLGAILGVAAWHTGVAKRIAVASASGVKNPVNTVISVANKLRGTSNDHTG